MTGPIRFFSFETVDAIEVEIVDIAPDEYGYSRLMQSYLGFPERYLTEPYIVNWRLTQHDV